MVFLRAQRVAAILQWCAQGKRLHADEVYGQREQDRLSLSLQTDQERAVLRRFAQIAVTRADGGLAVIRILPVTE